MGERQLRCRWRRAAAGLLACMALLASAAPAAADGDSLRLGAGTRALAMTTGPDGNLWFAGYSDPALASPGEPIGFAGVVGRVAAGGEVTEYRTSREASLTGIAAGADGALWLTEPAGGQILRASTGGELTEYPLPDRDAAPTAIVAGPDGALWFTERKADAIGRITTAGSITELPLPAGSAPTAIVVGGDGNLWIAAPGNHSIDSMTPAGNDTIHPIAGGNANVVRDLARGPDGKIWFTQSKRRSIGRLGPLGGLTEWRIARPADQIAAGPDGDLWFSTATPNGVGALVGPNGIASITQHGRPTRPVCVGGCLLAVSDLATGPGGELWYAKRTRYVEGGGTTGLNAASAPGVLGRFEPPGLALDLPPRAAADRSTASLRLGCWGGAAGQRCSGKLALRVRSGGRTVALGSARFDLYAGQTATVSLRLNAAARRLLRAGGGSLQTEAVSPLPIARRGPAIELRQPGAKPPKR